MGVNLCDLELRKDFLRYGTKCTFRERKKINDKSNFFEIENVSSLKGDINH